MTKYFLILIYFFVFFSCNKKNVQQPIWINKKKLNYFITDSFEFKSNIKNWKAFLFTVTQPIPLKVTYLNNSFKISCQNKIGIIEGPTYICLKSGEVSFFYSFFLKNNSHGEIINKDYRSPKTVNIDSGLTQQSLKFSIDKNRNIQLTNDGQYFLEENIKLKPVVTTFRAIAAEPLTSSYVQAGTVTNIPLNVIYIDSLKQFKIIAGKMYDKYNNIISNGTNVDFNYFNGKSKGLISATSINGIATVFLPINRNENYTVFATVNNIKSGKINLIKK